MITQLSEECRAKLFRLTLRAPVEGVAFVTAESREAAWRIGKTIVAVLRSVPIYEVEISDTRAFAELMQAGISEDQDLRVFEIAHADATVTEWARTPYFLTNDASLLGKWAELCAELAASAARAAIHRAK